MRPFSGTLRLAGRGFFALPPSHTLPPKYFTSCERTRYICSAADTAPRLLKRYCRKVYELGYVPICPKLNDGQYLELDNADEKRDFHNIARQKLGRCRMLVVCGKEISNSMSAEIGMAEKRNIICTTLDGLARIKEAGEDNAI